MSTDRKFVDAVADAWDAWSHEATFPFGRGAGKSGYCINATRTGIEALRTLGVKAKPASVTMLVLNQAADQLARADIPVEQWPAHAWSIGLGFSDTVDAAGGWDGHLVVAGDDFTLDLSGEQLERQGRIRIDCPLVLPALPPLGERHVWTTDGHVFVIERAPQHNAWRHATGWTVRRVRVEQELAERALRLLTRERWKGTDRLTGVHGLPQPVEHVHVDVQP